MGSGHMLVANPTRTGEVDLFVCAMCDGRFKPRGWLA